MHFNAEDLPFVLEFFTEYSERIPVRYFWSRQHVPTSIHLLTPVKENVSLGIRLYSKNGEPLDGVKMVLETSIYDEHGKQKEMIVPLTSRDHQEYVYRSQNSTEFPWRLGVYFFEVQLEDKIYSSGISVSPIHLTQEQVQHIHSVLEQEIDGMIYDLIYTQTSTSQEHEILKNKAYYDYVLRLIDQKDQLSSSLIQLERNPLDAIKTAYSIDEFEKKQDHKSLRWKDVRGGQSEYNKRKLLSMDIPQNRWMVHILLVWKHELLAVGKAISSDLNQARAVISHKEEEKLASEEHKHRFFMPMISLLNLETP